jgi:hypothetical protein
MQYWQSGLSSGYLPVNAVAGAGSTCGARSPDGRSPQSSPMYPDWDRSWRRRRERSRCLSISRLDDPLDATRSLRCARSASRRQCRRLLPAGWRAVRHQASRANSADPALASVPRYAAGTAGQLPPSPPGPVSAKASIRDRVRARTSRTRPVMGACATDRWRGGSGWQRPGPRHLRP